MKQMPILRLMEDRKLFAKFKKIAARKAKRRGPVEDINRSLAVVDAVLHDARDFSLEVEVVTWALKYMKENPELTISDAMVLGYEKWLK